MIKNVITISDLINKLKLDGGENGILANPQMPFFHSTSENSNFHGILNCKKADDYIYNWMTRWGGEQGIKLYI